MQANARDRALLHIKQAADELHVHPSTLRRQIARGDLDAVRLGENGLYRVSRRALEDFLRPAGPSRRI
jgi:excisionase family DNA binding protein